MTAGLRYLRAMLGGLALAAVAATATAAAAHDYVVVASTDPAVRRGQAVDAGARLPVQPGKSVTLMHASGDILLLKGAAGGVVAPVRKAASVDAARLEVLRSIVAPSTTQVAEGPGQRRSRAVCPTPDLLTTLDGLAQAQSAGCTDVAAQAFESWLAAQPVADAED